MSVVVDEIATVIRDLDVTKEEVLAAVEQAFYVTPADEVSELSEVKPTEFAKSNVVKFTVEFDSEVWASLDEDGRSDWINKVSDLLADEVHVSEVL